MIMSRRMQKWMQKTRICLLSIMGLALWAGAADAALYIPDIGAAKGIGGARSQALELDFRALEAAAMQFASDEAGTAAGLDGGNHIALLAKYTDVPGKFTAPGAYSFYVIDGAWWIGAAVARDAGRESIAAGAAAHGLFGSPDVDTPPTGAMFAATDGAAWKKVR